jgi:Putative Actinobacterial Holin-X, holin superfamily III/Protein of unknown function (DUF3618)
MFGGAGMFGFYALGALIATAILALATAVAPWLAALIVALVLAAIAGVLALHGRSKVHQATPPVPEQATKSVNEDVQWAKTRPQQARQGTESNDPAEIRKQLEATRGELGDTVAALAAAPAGARR